MNNELVVIRTFTSHIEADLAQSALEAVGIESMVRADDAGGMRPGLWASNGVALLVRAQDAEWAADIVNGSASGT